MNLRRQGYRSSLGNEARHAKKLRGRISNQEQNSLNLGQNIENQDQIILSPGHTYGNNASFRKVKNKVISSLPRSPHKANAINGHLAGIKFKSNGNKNHKNALSDNTVTKVKLLH